MCTSRQWPYKVKLTLVLLDPDIYGFKHILYYVTEMNNLVCGRYLVSKITQFRRCIFSTNIYIFRHLKLEIALVIPASNDEKYN